MLSVFPGLLPYGMVGIAIIRIVVGLVILYIGLVTIGLKRGAYSAEMKLKNFPLSTAVPIVFGLIEIITGSFLIFGFLTQIMVLIVVYLCLNLIFIEKHVGRVFDYPNIFYITLIFVSIGLLFLGPGTFAVDLPL